MTRDELQFALKFAALFAVAVVTAVWLAGCGGQDVDHHFDHSEGLSGTGGVSRYRDAELGVTCWVRAYGISCLRDPLDGGAK